MFVAFETLANKWLTRRQTDLNSVINQSRAFGHSVKPWAEQWSLDSRRPAAAAAAALAERDIPQHGRPGMRGPVVLVREDNTKY